jgi:hypothetical protein
MAIHKYHLFKGDLYVPLNENPKMKEINGIWLLIPRELIQLNGEDASETRKIHPETEKCLRGIIWRTYLKLGSLNATAEELEIGVSTAKRHVDRQKDLLRAEGEEKKRA